MSRTLRLALAVSFAVAGSSLLAGITFAVEPPRVAPAAVSVRTVTPEPGGEAEAPAAAETAPPASSDALVAGWPVDLNAPGAGFPYTPTLFDVDGDGADEIFLTGGDTFGLKGDGTFLPGWPTTEHLYMGYGTNDQKPGPSAADVDGDGDVEVMWSERDWYAGSAHMWCFNGRNANGSNMPGFPQEAPDDFSNALDVPFVLGDVDGDGDLEAWGPHSLGNAFIHYRISAFDHLGTKLFTRDLDPTENTLSLYFGDLDGDGSREMFAVTLADSTTMSLHAFDADGNDLPGYPRLLHTLAGEWLTFGPPAVADLDGDADLELLFGTWSGGAARVRAFHHDAGACAGFPIDVGSGLQLFYVGLGDLTGDLVPELVVTGKVLGSDYRVFAIEIASGASLAGWPYVLPAWPEGFPTVADVDDDGYQEVCVSTDAGDVRAISRSGQLLAGYPLAMSAPAISGVAAGDIDGDGLYELVAATWDGFVYAWDTTGRAIPGRADWPLRNVNARNTGVYGDHPGDVFWDGFESGDTGRWSLTVP